MEAFPIGGTPRIYPIGSDVKQLSWTIDYDIGTNLVLIVVDASNSTGGVGPQLYTVSQGPSTSCIKKDFASDFKVFANVTSPAIIQTCDPWAITASGGSPPYTFVLAAISSPVITEVPAVLTDYDELIYINRANPNGQLLAIVTDSTGNFAYGSPIVDTQGSTNATCSNLESTLVTSKDGSKMPGAVGNATRKSTPTGAIVGGVIGGLLLLVTFIVGVIFFKRRQRQEHDMLQISAVHRDAPYTDHNAMDDHTTCGEAQISAFPVVTAVPRSKTTNMTRNDANTSGLAGVGTHGLSEPRVSFLHQRSALETGRQSLHIRSLPQTAIGENVNEDVRNRDTVGAGTEPPPPYLYPEPEALTSRPGESATNIDPSASDAEA